MQFCDTEYISDSAELTTATMSGIVRLSKLVFATNPRQAGNRSTNKDLKCGRVAVLSVTWQTRVTLHLAQISTTERPRPVLTVDLIDYISTLYI